WATTKGWPPNVSPELIPLCCRVLPVALNCTRGFGVIRFAGIDPYRHPPPGRPLHRLTLETEEYPQRRQQRRGREQVRNDRGHRVVGDALRVRGEAGRECERRHRRAGDPEQPPH